MKIIERIKENKQNILIVLGLITLIALIGGVTFAFFNYTRTGAVNTVRVGEINFNSTQETITLTNVFPTSSDNLNSSNSATATINIEGNTTYSEGIEYKVSIVDVNNTINEKDVPISFQVDVTNLGTQSSDYYNERGSDANVYNLVEEGEVSDNQLILIGYIKNDSVGVNGSIDITAFIDKEKVGISDTVSKIENGELIYGGTKGDWIAGRTILTTEEWNSLTGNNALSFRIKVEANEGIWVNEPQYTVLKNLASIQSWTNIRANVTSIEFHTDGVAPANAITSFDATDLTSSGLVTVYTLDNGLGNSTVKAIICAADVIYAPENSQGMFMLMTSLTDFNSENFQVDNVTNMQAMFRRCSVLADLSSMSTWNVSKVENMTGMFYECASIENLNDLAKWNTLSLKEFSMLFLDCTSLSDISGLRNWNTSSVENMNRLFENCTSLENIDGLINWNTSNVLSVGGMFYDCTSLKNIDGLINWNTSNVTNMNSIFSGCTNLQNIDGLGNWNVSNVTYMEHMFNRCSSLTNVDLSNWNMSNLTSDNAMFQHAGFTTLIMPDNYTRIDNFMFNHNSSYNGSSFTIPKTVTTVGNSHVFYDFGKDGIFNKFIVESGSTSLKTIDDVLYTYDGTRLISIPRGKTFTNRTYEMPEGIIFMNELSFSRNQNIDIVILPNSYVIERYIEGNTSDNPNNNNYGFINSGNSLSVAIYRYTSIKEYKVKDDNTRYISYEGCIYSKDGTELIAVPLHYTGVLNIKVGTTTIGQEAFWTTGEADKFDNITLINIPVSVTTIEANQLSTLNALMSRSTNKVTITIDAGNTAYQISNNKIVAK